MNHMLLLRKKRQRKGSNYEELKHVFLQTSLQLNTTYLSLHKLKLRVPTLPQKWPWQGVSTDRTQLAKEDKQRNKTACCWCHWQTKILLLNCYVLNRTFYELRCFSLKMGICYMEVENTCIYLATQPVQKEITVTKSSRA